MEIEGIHDWCMGLRIGYFSFLVIVKSRFIPLYTYTQLYILAGYREIADFSTFIFLERDLTGAGFN
jgi:hypothetical protein